MARPANDPYTLGKITCRPHPTLSGQVQARGYFTDGNAKRREVTASGKTDAAAKRALQSKANEARNEFRGGDDVLAHDTKVKRAGEVWLDWKRRQKDKAGQPLAAETMRAYEMYVRLGLSTGPLSELTVVQANNIARVESWLTLIADERGEVAARQSKKVLSGVLGLAERRGAIPASIMHRVHTPGASAGSTGDRKCSDPDCDLDCGKRHLDTRRAFTAVEAVRVQAVADNARADVGDLSAFLFGTGARIAEALHHTAWADVDLYAQTVRIRGTKTASADRILAMSDDLTTRLSDRAELHGTTGLVFGVTYFASKLGQPRDRNNVAKALRRVFATADVPWAGTHTFRRTVASWLDEAGAPLAEIANQLGHADTNVTAGYLGRRTAPTRAADVMVLPKAKPSLRAV